MRQYSTRQYSTRHRDSAGPHRVTKNLNIASVRDGGRGTGDGGRGTGDGGRGTGNKKVGEEGEEGLLRETVA